VHNTRRFVQLEDLLDVPLSTREFSQLALLRVLRIDGQLDQAILSVEDRLARPEVELPAAVNFACEYAWMMREKQTPGRALPEIDRLLAKSSANRGGMVQLLNDRARLHASMGDWKAAQKDVESAMRHAQQDNKVNYRNWSDSCLILGLIRQQRGDHAGAVEAWRQGKKKEGPDDFKAQGALMNGMIFMNMVLLDALCQDLDDKRTETLFRAVMRDQPAVETMLNLVDTKSLFRSGAVIVNRMWHTPRGKEIAQKMVLQTCSFEDYMRFPVQLFVAEMTREESIGAKITPEQDELLWKFTEQGAAAFSSGKLTEGQAMQLAMLWKRGPTFLGGIEVIKGLEPALRGPGAYFMGLRLQRLGRPADDAFRMALDSAPMNSPLQRLARTEWEQLSKKKTP